MGRPQAHNVNPQSLVCDPITQLSVEGQAFADAADRDLAADVPTCPGWTVANLVEHLGRVHSWVMRCLDNSPDEVVRLADEPPAPCDASVSWYRGLHSLIVERLANEAPERIVAGPRGPVSVAWWRRRQGHEASIHRWDAQNATGIPQAIMWAWAIDGVDEYCDVFLPIVRLTSSLAPETLCLQIGEDGPAWLLSFVDGRVSGLRSHRVRHKRVLQGTSSDLLLWVWGRPADVRLHGRASSPEMMANLQQRLRY